MILFLKLNKILSKCRKAKLYDIANDLVEVKELVEKELPRLFAVSRINAQQKIGERVDEVMGIMGWADLDFIKSKTREDNLVLKRYLLWYILRTEDEFVLKEIATFFKRDHATIIAGLHRFRNFLSISDKKTIEIYEHYLQVSAAKVQGEEHAVPVPELQ